MPEPRAGLHPLRSDGDLLVILEASKTLARSLGFERRAVLELELALREIGTNALRHAGGGEVELCRLDGGGIEAVVLDRGPGIPDLEAAFSEGYSTAGSLGLGLPAARRLCDVLEVTGSVGGGTRVRLVKWGRRRA